MDCHFVLARSRESNPQQVRRPRIRQWVDVMRIGIGMSYLPKVFRWGFGYDGTYSGWRRERRTNYRARLRALSGTDRASKRGRRESKVNLAIGADAVNEVLRDQPRPSCGSHRWLGMGGSAEPRTRRSGISGRRLGPGGDIASRPVARRPLTPLCSVRGSDFPGQNVTLMPQLKSVPASPAVSSVIVSIHSP